MVAEALATPNSRRVMAICIRLSRSARDISQISGLPLTTVYRQVRRLEKIGVLVVERSAMTPDGRKYDLYRSRLRKAHLDLDDVGERVRWEPIDPIDLRSTIVPHAR
jgi:predicted transcriptional regulator